MGGKGKIVAALVVGVAIGAVAVPGLRAQTAGQETYVVAEMRATDPAAFIEYMRLEPGSLAPYHGRVAARGLPDVREGEAPDGVVTIYAFANPEDANRWYYSPEYAKLIAMRQKSAKSKVYFLTGIVSR
jgi:uncharacterized protein (DUF1330 family)